MTPHANHGADRCPCTAVNVSRAVCYKPFGPWAALGVCPMTPLPECAVISCELLEAWPLENTAPPAELPSGVGTCPDPDPLRDCLKGTAASSSCGTACLGNCICATVCLDVMLPVFAKMKRKPAMRPMMMLSRLTELVGSENHHIPTTATTTCS